MDLSLSEILAEAVTAGQIIQGLTLQRLRKQRRMSQAQLAAKMGVVQQLIAYWEAGRYRISFDQQEKLWDALNVSEELWNSTFEEIKLQQHQKSPKSRYEEITTPKKQLITFIKYQFNDPQIYGKLAQQLESGDQNAIKYAADALKFIQKLIDSPNE